MERTKTMKNYLEYDFAAIVGAEVKLQVKFFGCHEGKVLCRWEFQGKPYLTILVSKPDGNHLSDIPVDEIVPGSLSATITPEDMSVKQLKKAFNLGTYEVLVFNEATGTIASRDVDGGELGHTYEELPFNDYIDCTDWGWKHE